MTGHKGQVSHREQQKKATERRKIKASIWYPTYPVDEALRRAGLIEGKAV